MSVAEAAAHAGSLYDELDLDALPPQLRRNSLDYYYLSVWPGLAHLPEVEAVAAPAGPVRAAYVHLPFCSGLCHFCSYFVVVARDPAHDDRLDRYVDLLLLELDLHRDRCELDVSYLYFGGGTPSLLAPRQLDRLLTGFEEMGVLGEGLLGSIEAHPELFADAPRARSFLDVLDAHGITRVSVGMESADDALLAATNRRHRADGVAGVVELLRDRGLLVNLDLMYGLPGQSLETWIASLQAALALDPDSVSTYFTFVDPGTRLWHQIRRGETELPDHRLVQTQHLAAQSLLEEAGHLELPGDFWSVPDTEPAAFVQETLPSDARSLGLGAGAYGFYDRTQYFNEFGLGAYANRLRRREVPVWRAAALDARQSRCRDVMFSFKNAPHLDLALFSARHGSSPLAEWPDEFRRLEELRLVDIDRDRVRPTAKGRLVAEEVACMFEPAGHHAGVRLDGAPPVVRRHNYAPTYSAPAARA